MHVKIINNTYHQVALSVVTPLHCTPLQHYMMVYHSVLVLIIM